MKGFPQLTPPYGARMECKQQSQQTLEQAFCHNDSSFKEEVIQRKGQKIRQ
jgi:hypothetical protein